MRERYGNIRLPSKYTDVLDSSSKSSESSSSSSDSGDDLAAGMYNFAFFIAKILIIAQFLYRKPKIKK